MRVARSDRRVRGRVFTCRVEMAEDQREVLLAKHCGWVDYDARWHQLHPCSKAIARSTKDGVGRVVERGHAEAYASVGASCNRTRSRQWRGIARGIVVARQLSTTAASALLVCGMILPC